MRLVRCCGILVVLALLGAGAARAQTPPVDRDRAQLRQMQQQMQRLQQDNANLQAELDKRSKEAEKVRTELSTVRARAGAGDKEIEKLQAEVTRLKDDLLKAVAEGESRATELKARDTALREAQAREALLNEGQTILAARLKIQTALTDRCEARRVATVQFSEQMLSRYEKDSLRACEPITGLWRINAETQIQQLRDRLADLQSDSVPQPTSAVAR
jgi:chromosome segregation ATPase